MLPDSSKPKFRNLPEEERAIAERIAISRRYKGLGQTDLAAIIGITRDQLASIETARVTLPFGVAANIADALQLSLRWLAEGIPPGLYYISPEPELLESLDSKSSFIESYNSTLRKFFERKHDEFEKSIREASSDDNYVKIAERLSPKKETAQWMDTIVSNLRPVLHEVFDILPMLLRYELAMQIGRLTTQFEAENKDEIKSFAMSKSAMSMEAAKISSLKKSSCGKDSLDNVKSPDTVSDMRLEVPTWPELKKSILGLTVKRGEKSALAKKLGVSRQVLGNWLSDNSQGMPNAELTLDLLKWVRIKSSSK